MARNAAARKPRKTQAVLDGVSVLARQMRKIEGADGVTPERLSVLAIIAKEQPISIGLLAERSNVRPATMSRMITAMDVEGLIRRQADSSDGRGVLISLTRKGKSVFDRANEQSLQTLESALSHLSKEEMRILVELGKALTSFYR